MEPDPQQDPVVAPTAPVAISDPERLAVKTVCASDILKNVVQSAEKLSKIDKVLSRYLNQARLLLVWKRGSGAVKMAGSAAKTVGTLMLVAAPLHPKINMGMRVAHRLWKLGTGLKILNAIANVIRDVWQKGCRSVLLEFTHCAATLTRNLGVFGEVLRDLQSATPGSDSVGINSPLVVMSAIREFIPAHQIPYATHVINMAFGNERYSPLFAFTSLTLDSQNSSNVAQIMLEIESFHFDDFIETSESRGLVAIGSFLHVSRELFDFLDGFQSLTERDCQFLQDCLKRLSEESVSIMKAVSVLISLDRIRKQLNSDASANTATAGASSADTPSLYNTLETDQPGCPSAEVTEPSAQLCNPLNNTVQIAELPVSSPESDNGVTSSISSLSLVEDVVNISPDEHKKPSPEFLTAETACSEIPNNVMEIDNQPPAGVSACDNLETPLPLLIPIEQTDTEVPPSLPDVIPTDMESPPNNTTEVASAEKCETSSCGSSQQSKVPFQARAFVSSLLSPFSTVVDKGGNLLAESKNNLLSSSAYLRDSVSRRGRKVEQGDQFSRAPGEACDPSARI